jgi:hypothetical protein
MSGKGKDLNNVEKRETLIRRCGNTVEVEKIGLGDVERMVSSQKIEIEMLTYPTTFPLDHERIQEIARLNKVKAYMSRESGKLFLNRDDILKVEVFKKLGLTHVYVDVEECENDSEALMKAEIGRFREPSIILDSEKPNILEKVRKSLEYFDITSVVKMMIREGFSQSYAYNLAKLAIDDEIYDRVIRRELSLRDAIQAFYWKKSGLPIEEFVKKKKRFVEPAEELTSIEKPIPLSKTAFERIYKQIVREVVYEVGSFPGTIRSHMMDAFWSLRNILRSREEMKELLIEAIDQLRGRKSIIQKKAIWIWVKHVKSGKKISFREAEEKAMEGLGITPPTGALKSPGGRGGDV